MKTGINPARITRTALSALVFFVLFAGTNRSLAADLDKTGSPELVGQLTKGLSITPAQASGGAGALFGLAKSRLSAADFSKVADSVPGMDSLIKSAPAASTGLSGLGSSLPGALGGLAAVAGPFKKLGLSPEMATKFVPILTQFVQSKGGASVAGLLSKALQ